MNKTNDSVYNWKRFWHPVDTELRFFDGGFLADPESEHGKWYNPNALSFEAINEKPYLILLGEQGIGKSTALKEASIAIPDSASSLFVDVGEFQTDALLDSHIFSNRKIDKWLNGEQVLYLFLDSLDEGTLTPEIVTGMLSRRLQDYPIDRLRLRIACRTSAWPGDLERKLNLLWNSDDSVKTYELAPLRQKDAEEAARANDIDERAFLREVYDREVVPLAARPLTLKMLLREYSKSQRLPSRVDDLMHNACLELCEEITSSRKKHHSFSARKRLAVAERIAAITTLANKTGVWCGYDRARLDDGPYIPIDDLCGGNEYIGEYDEIKVSELAIREALSTGLFNSCGVEEMGWCHHSFAEYLSACYLADRMTSDQILSLIVHPNDPARKLVPQLYGVAAWLLGMKSDLMAPILDADFSVLLQCDPAVVNDVARAKATECLLHLYENNELYPSFNPQYRKLKHPGIVDQIKPYICDSSKRLNVRYAAIDIAEACKLDSLQNDLVDIALDSSEPHALRVNAAYAVKRLGSPETKAKLKPLAAGEAGEDPDDQLKGCGLRVLWPSGINAKELFSFLTQPKTKIIGSYQHFCGYELFPHLQPTDLPFALEWIEQNLTRLGYWSEKLVEGIISMAWDNLNAPGVLSSLAKTVVAQLKNHYPAYFGTSENVRERRRVAKEVISIAANTNLEPTSFCFCNKPLVTNGDVDWLLQELDSAEPDDVQRFISKVIYYMADVYHQPDQLDAVLISCQQYPILAEVFAHLLKPIVLGSNEAKKMEEDYKRLHRMQREAKKPILVPPPSERVRLRLKECQDGNLIAWHDLNLQLMLELDSTHYDDVTESDLTILPGWRDADNDLRAEIVEVAKEYILKHIPQSQEWLKSDLVVNYQLDYSGYRAFRLLWQEAHDFITDLSTGVWSRWAPVILASYDFRESSSGFDLLKMAYENAPDEIVDALLSLIDRDNLQHSHVLVTKFLTDLWDESIAQALLRKSRDKGLKPDSLRELLRILLIHKDKATIDFAVKLVGLWDSSDEYGRIRAEVAAQSLLLYAPCEGWLTVWPIVCEDSDFGVKVVEKVVDVWGWDGESHGSSLSDEQLADFYTWVVHHYPYEEDPAIEGFIGTRAGIAMWKNTAIQILEKRGASQAIERIVHEFPNIDWLRRVLAESRVVARYNSWLPSKPENILKLASNERYRIIRSGRELLDTIEESLQRLQKKLKGETPAVVFLWDHIMIRKKLYKPKDESALSDFVKIHLVDDLQSTGVIFNREVEIRHFRGSVPGERTDILVSTFIRDRQGNPRDLITVVIEVKGCWNRELNTAMRTQLADRYLKDNSCQHGLYLVGWFDSDCWLESDSRRKAKPNKSLIEVQQQFQLQARQLSRDGRDIRSFVMDASLC